MRTRILFSQNFIKSPALVSRLIQKSSISRTDTVYEIGTGDGIITKNLALCCRTVHSYELDNKYFRLAAEKLRKFSNIKLHLGNFLDAKLPLDDFKIFANIPFNITADIIRKVTTSNSLIDSYLVVQAEAAARFSGKPLESQLSLLLKPWFDTRIVHLFQSKDFFPIPKVRIVLLRITKRDKPFVNKDVRQLYRDFIVYAFNQFKPNLSKALTRIFSGKQFKRLSASLHFRLNALPSELSWHQWLGLFNYFTTTDVESRKKMLVLGAEKRLLKQQERLTKRHRTVSRSIRRSH